MDSFSFQWTYSYVSMHSPMKYLPQLLLGKQELWGPHQGCQGPLALLEGCWKGVSSYHRLGSVTKPGIHCKGLGGTLLGVSSRQHANMGSGHVLSPVMKTDLPSTAPCMEASSVTLRAAALLFGDFLAFLFLLGCPSPVCVPKWLIKLLLVQLLVGSLSGFWSWAQRMVEKPGAGGACLPGGNNHRDNVAVLGLGLVGPPISSNLRLARSPYYYKLIQILNTMFKGHGEVNNAGG